MKTGTYPIVLATLALLGIVLSRAYAEQPEDYRRQWNDPEVVSRIEIDTEQYRKADAVLRILDDEGRPIDGAKVRVEQQTHEFLFGCNLFVLDQLPTPELNAKYEKAFTKLFNFATLPFYWGDLEPEQGKPRFAEGASYIWRRPPPDRLLAWCKGSRDHTQRACLVVREEHIHAGVDSSRRSESVHAAGSPAHARICRTLRQRDSGVGRH